MTTQKISIDIQDAPLLACPACQGVHFIGLIKFHKLSPLVIPAGASDIITEQVYQCQNPECHTIYNNPTKLQKIRSPNHDETSQSSSS